ncbi:MAG: 30S ribosomal protein S2 [Candidatus Azosocius agrarius]|nr:MAG: 30S ribosomal protein S2 [Gammaproteobacteria bacterium]
MNKINIKILIEAGVHFGHLNRFRNLKMEKYIFDTNCKINIINLESTLFYLRQAMFFVSKLIVNKGQIMFIGTKKVARNIIKECAINCEMPYVNYRWLGGMLTNYKTIKQSIKRLHYLQKMQEDNGFDKLTKKEGLILNKEMNKLELILGGIKNMSGLPDALFIIDVGCENIAVKEANKLKIPVIGIVDTNSDPDGIDYIIPGNDDAISAIKLYCETISNVIISSRSKFENDVEDVL